jgi:hypothetical protein
LITINIRAAAYLLLALAYRIYYFIVPKGKRQAENMIDDSFSLLNRRPLPSSTSFFTRNPNEIVYSKIQQLIAKIIKTQL